MQMISVLKVKGKPESDIKLAIKGDNKAFQRLIESNYSSMYRVALSMLGNKHDIEDAMQETIVKAYKGIVNLKKEEYFKTWLIRILINECNDTLKDTRKVVSIEKVNYETSHTETLINLELTNAINLLDVDLKVVTTLFYFEDLLQKDIAKILNIPEGTVHSRLSRARSKLYEMLKERCD